MEAQVDGLDASELGATNQRDLFNTAPQGENWQPQKRQARAYECANTIRCASPRCDEVP